MNGPSWRMRPHWGRMLLLTVLLLGLRPAGSAAGESSGTVTGQEKGASQAPTGLFGFGTQEIGIAVGPGFAVAIGGTDSEELRDVQYLRVAPRWGIQVTDPMGESWYRGNVELVLDGQLQLQLKPRRGFGGGPIALLRYNFLGARSVVPFVDFGGGIMITDFDLKERPDGVDFAYQVGIGLHYFVSQNVAVTVSPRFHHVSNAYLKAYNLGINSVLVEIGVSTFFK